MTEPDRPRRRSGPPPLAAHVVVLLVLLGVATRIALDAPVDRGPQRTLGAVQLGDLGTNVSFDVPDRPASLPRLPEDRSWSTRGGTWGVLDESAYLSRREDPAIPAIALLPAPNDVSVVVRFARVADGSGVVIRATQLDQYLAVVLRTDDGGVVELVQREGDAVEVLATSEPIGSVRGAHTLRVLAEDTTIRVLLDDEAVLEAEVPGATAPDATRAGLLAEGSDATKARFDDLTIVDLALTRLPPPADRR